MIMQKTIKKPVLFQGIGVHSGAPCSVLVKPAPADHGIVFANAEHAGDVIKLGSCVPEDAMHASVLKARGWVISTVEHLLAALCIAGIDNAILEVSGGEVPILDGSAYPFLYKLNAAGVLQLDAPRHFLVPRRSLSIAQQDKLIVIEPLAHDARITSLLYEADFGPQMGGKVCFDAALSRDVLRSLIAPARTFGFLHQLPMLRSMKLSQGSSLGNTVVFDDQSINEQRMAGEYLHHKILDLVGDLFLLGHTLQAKIKAIKTGHSFNRLVIKHYIEHPEEWQLVMAKAP